LEYYPKIDRAYHAIRKDVLIRSEYFKALCEDSLFGKDPENPFIFEVYKMPSAIHFYREYFDIMIKCLFNGCIACAKDDYTVRTLRFFGVKYNQLYIDDLMYNIDKKDLLSDDKIVRQYSSATGLSPSQSDIMEHVICDIHIIKKEMREFLNRMVESSFNKITIKCIKTTKFNMFEYISDEIKSIKIMCYLWNFIDELFIDAIKKTAILCGYSISSYLPDNVHKIYEFRR
jgi:hypothetical protein